MHEDENVSPAPLIAVGSTWCNASTFFANCKSNKHACDSSVVIPANRWLAEEKCQR